MKTLVLAIAASLMLNFASIAKADESDLLGNYGEEAVMAAAADCGVPKEYILRRYDELLQDDVFSIKVGANGERRSAALCLAYWNAGGANLLEFDDEVVNKKRDANEQIHAAFLGRVSADSWLSAAGLWGKQRAFDPTKESIKDYLHFVEKTCKAKLGSMLSEVLPGLVSYASDERSDPLSDSSMRSFGCVTAMMNYAELEKHGFSFGIIGNAPLPVEDQK